MNQCSVCLVSMCELQPDFGLALRCTMSASMQFEKGSFYISNSSSKIPETVCGDSGTSLLTWSQRGVGKSSQLQGHFKQSASFCWVGFPFIFQRCIDRDALWLVLSDQIRQHAAHALNCFMFDCDGVKRIETVVCQN